MNNDYKTKDYLYLRLYALKAGEGNDNNQDYIQIVKRIYGKVRMF